MEKFTALPLCTSPLSHDEAIRLNENMIPLLRFLGAPGDWGYDSKLGMITILLKNLHADVTRIRSTNSND